MVVDGPIEDGDYMTIVSHLRNGPPAVALLNSPGGRVDEAMRIGTYLNRRGYHTVVARNGMCASACALIWLAGDRRAKHSRSLIGFHAVFSKKDGAL